MCVCVCVCMCVCQRGMKETSDCYIYYSLSTGKHHSSGAALSLVPTALVTILATNS